MGRVTVHKQADFFNTKFKGGRITRFSRLILNDYVLSNRRLTAFFIPDCFIFSHNHDKRRRRRDMEKCFNQKEVTRKRDRKTGLNTTSYSIAKVYDLAIDGISITVLNVLLQCDKSATPWCDCNNATK